MNKRAFTVKSILLSLVGVVVVCTFPVYCEKVLGLKGAIGGYLPTIPVLLLVLLSLVWNMTLGRWQSRLAFGSGELAVVFCLMLAVAWLPELQSRLVNTLVLPRYSELTGNATWQDAGVTTRLPDSLFPAAGPGERIGEKVHFGFIQGGLEMRHAPLRAWGGPLLRWLPLIVLLGVSLMALTVLVHRQWTRHEQLRYPLASIAGALIDQGDGRPGGVLFRNRLFWWGFVFVFGFQLLRYVQAWYPAQLPKLPVEYGLDWGQLLPIISADRSNAGFFLIGWMPICFLIVGMAFFVPTDVSLSMGLTAPLGTLLGIQYYLATGDPVSSSDLEFFRAGGFMAFGLILAYTGRTYYFPLLRKAVLPGGGGRGADPGGVFAARVFLAGGLGLVITLAQMGMGWLVAVVAVGFALLIFLVVTRLVCETGIPAIAGAWSLPKVAVGLFGPAALGATPLVFMSLLSGVIVASSSTQLAMPYLATGLRVLDDREISLKRFLPAAKVAFLLALGLGFVTILVVTYTHGEGKMTVDGKAGIDLAVHEILNLKDTGRLDASAAAHGLGKLRLIRPDGRAAGLVFSGLLAVLATCLLRFRFAKWPLHPLFFVMLGAWNSRSLWFSFLLGWLIKTLVIKFGGGCGYRSLKPLFIGFILGDVMILALMFSFGLLYHGVTGSNPVSIWMLP